jgi:hypothetical protein
MQGFIKIHRSIIDWEWYKDANTMRLFLHLLLNATHKDIKIKGLLLKSGQLITSRSILASELAMSQQQVRTSLDKLKSTNEITNQLINRNTIITIVNWNRYQAEQPDIQPINNQIVTNIYKNVKNSSSSIVDKNENKNCFYGEFNNVYLTYEQYSKLKTMILNDVALNEIINALSNEIESGSQKYKKYEPEFPNAHYVHLKNFWRYRSYTGIKNAAKSTATKDTQKTKEYNFGY